MTKHQYEAWIHLVIDFVIAAPAQTPIVRTSTVIITAFCVIRIGFIAALIITAMSLIITAILVIAAPHRTLVVRPSTVIITALCVIRTGIIVALIITAIALPFVSYT
jgi:hypothetical protein